MGMISAFILLQFLYSPSFGQVHGDKELLLLIMNGHRENIERISSWRGQALIRLHTEGRGADKRDMLSRAEFVYDGDLEATRWSWGLVEDKAENADGTKWENSKYFKNVLIPWLLIHFLNIKDQISPTISTLCTILTKRLSIWYLFQISTKTLKVSLKTIT